MNKQIILSFSVLLLTNIIQCQNMEISWQQCFGTLNSNPGYGIVETENGYLIATGTSDSTGLPNYHGSGDIWLIETDNLGNKIWEKCYGGSGGDAPVKIIRTSNDYVVLGGTTSIDGDVQSNNNGGIDYWIVKINALGEILWEKCYGTPNNEGPNDIIKTPDGGLLVMGRIHSSGGDVSVYYGSNDVWMFKTDSIGNIEWEKTLGNQWNDNGVSIMLNSEGNIMLIGAVDHFGDMVECGPDNFMGDVWLVELDLAGNIISQHCFGGSSYEYGVLIEESENSYVFIAGSYSNDGDVSGLHGPPGIPPDGWGDIWIVKLNEQFEIIWQKCLGGYDVDSPNFISKTEDYGFIVIGTTFSDDGDVSGNHSNPGWDADIWAVKLNSLGEIEWQQCYGGWGSERLENPHTILKKDDYNYAIASSTDYGPSFDVECTPTGGNDGASDAWIIEIDIEDTTNIYEDIVEDEIRIYPNPAGDYLVFEVRSSRFKVERNEIQIFDVFGREVLRKVVAREQTVIDLRGIMSGIYFYRVKVKERVYSGKVVVQK